MEKNVGRTERIIRAILGIIIILVGVLYQSWWGTIGAIIIMPSIFAWDPLYALLKRKK